MMKILQCDPGSRNGDLTVWIVSLHEACAYVDREPMCSLSTYGS